MVNIKEVNKALKSAGLRKKEVQRVNFQTVILGDYSISHLKRFGQNAIMINPINGNTYEGISSFLSTYKPEIKAGYVVIRM